MPADSFDIDRLVVQVRTEESFGSGLLVARDSVLTCAHVVLGKDRWAGVQNTWRRIHDDVRGALETAMSGVSVRLPLENGTIPDGPEHRRAVRGPVLFPGEDLTIYGTPTDLALLRLAEPIEWDDFIEPCLLLGATAERWSKFEHEASFQVLGYPDGGLVREECQTVGSLSGATRRGILYRFQGQGAPLPQGYSGGPIFAKWKGKRLCVGLAYLGGETTPNYVGLTSDTILAFLGEKRDNKPLVKVTSWDLGSAIDKEAAKIRRRYFEFVRSDHRELPRILAQRGSLPARAKRRLTLPVTLKLDGKAQVGLAMHRISLEEYLATAREGQGHRLVLAGAPGAGKTTLLQYSAWDYADRELTGAGVAPRTPVYVQLPDLAQHLAARRDKKPPSFWDVFTEFLPVTEAAVEFLNGERLSGRLLLLLDSLDEVHPTARPVLEAFLRRLAIELDDGVTPEMSCAAVVATRHDPAPTFDEPFQLAELLPLEGGQRELFLETYWQERSRESQNQSGETPRPSELRPGGRSAAEWVAWFERQESFRYLSGNPLWLTLAAWLLWDRRSGEAPSPRRIEFYLQLVYALLKDDHKQPPRPWKHTNVAVEALQTLAWDMLSNGKRERTPEDIEDFLAFNLKPIVEDAKQEPLQARFRLVWSSATEFLKTVRAKGLLYPKGGPLGAFGFLHNVVQEALAAGEMLQAHARGGAPLALAQTSETGELNESLAEPVAIYAESTDDAEQRRAAFNLLLTRPDTALRTLVTSPTADLEIIEEALARVAHGAERTAVLRRAFELVAPSGCVDDRLATVALLERLGNAMFTRTRRDRSGTKLYHPRSVRLDRQLWREAFGERMLHPDSFERIAEEFWIIDDVLRTEAARANAASEEGVARCCTEARLGLFDRLPDPRIGRTDEEFEELFLHFDRGSLWTKVPGGWFWMGSPEEDEWGEEGERPAHRVFLDAFLMARVPVTHAQFAVFDPHHVSFWQTKQLGDIDYCPVTDVSWWSCVLRSLALPTLDAETKEGDRGRTARRAIALAIGEPPERGSVGIRLS